MQSLLDHKNLVGAANGGEPVRDHERRAPLHQLVQPRLDHRLRLGVERAGRLVENQNARLRQQARAIDSRCRCPPESFTPRSPTIVS